MAAVISAKQVQALRERTGVGMMKCKEALIATDGDMEKAVDMLREKGLAAAEKKASRIAAEGVIAQYNADGVAVLVEVNAETDFVAKNPQFKEFAENIAKVVHANNPADVEALLNMKYLDSDVTVEDARKEKVLVIGENIQIRRFVRIEGHVFNYNHGDGKIGVLVNFDADDAALANPEFATVAKNVCLQIAAMNPAYQSKENVPAEIINKEKEILLAQIKNDPKNANKPEAILEKMIGGKINKYYTENCLLQQELFLDESFTIEKYIATMGKDVKLVNFVRMERGEGIEKRVDNFAEEVANMTK